jgi:hypothetical protein
METPRRRNASEAPSPPQAPTVPTIILDTPMTSGEDRLDPPSPSLPYSQALEGIGSSIVVRTVLGFQPTSLYVLAYHVFRALVPTRIDPHALPFASLISIEPFSSLHSLGTNPLPPKKFSATTHRPMTNPNRKRGLPTSPLEPIIIIIVPFNVLSESETM